MDSALKTPTIGLSGPTPLLRLQSDERLVSLARRGNPAAFEALVGRYESRLLGFTRHMLGSREDAEDVLQEVFAAAYHAMLADERPINVRPWLYRIARNRSLNHLRRQQPIGVDSMDIHLADHGTTTADRVHRREDFRHLLEDVGGLPETQRTALLLREIDALSYEQIAEAMETTVPSVKSLLVRARVSLAEAAEARQLTCEEVRDELGQVAEGITRMSPPVRRHLKACERCAGFQKQLRANNRAMAALLPVAPLLAMKNVILTHLGLTTGTGAVAGAAAMSTAAVTSTGAMTAGFGALASKAAAGLAAAAVVTAGAVEVGQVRQTRTPAAVAPAMVTPAPAAEPVVVTSRPQPTVTAASVARGPERAQPADRDRIPTATAASAPEATETPVVAVTPVVATAQPAEPAAPTERGGDAVTLPAEDIVAPALTEPITGPAPTPVDPPTVPAPAPVDPPTVPAPAPVDTSTAPTPAAIAAPADPTGVAGPSVTTDTPAPTVPTVP